MARAIRRGSALAIVICMTAPLPAADDIPSHQTIAKRAKAATALVVVEPPSALGFCVNSSGLFVTNEHVVRESDEPINLVLNSQLKNRQALKAKVIRRNKTLDLALLKVEGNQHFEALELGSDKDLGELSELIACGCSSPGAISFHVGSVTSLRRAKDGELHRIQLDAALDPSDSGGPVLDRSGKVIGMVVAGIPRLGVPPSGITMAIPVSHLRRFLAPPEIVFTPPKIRASNQHELFEFTAKALPIVPSKESLDLELVLGGEAAKERHFPMKLSGGIFQAKAVPFPAPEGPRDSRLEVTAVPCTIVARQGGIELGRLATTVCVQDLCRAIPPKLLSPAERAVLDNNYMRTAFPSGAFVWEFSWSEVPGASTYHLYVMGARATIPVIDKEVDSLSYRHVSKGGVIADHHLKDWSWKVRSRVNGQWSEWSEVRKFDVKSLSGAATPE